MRELATKTEFCSLGWSCQYDPVLIMEVTFSDAITNDSVGNEMMNGYARDLWICV
jgi:hypothetical protein